MESCPREPRALRGASFAALAVLLAAAAHTLAGGGAPTPLFCAVAAVLATPGAVLLAGPRARTWRTVAAVAGGQLVFHLALTAMGDLGRWEAGATGHVHGSAIVMTRAVAIDPLLAGDAGSAGMALAHGAATLLTACAVLRGERALSAVWRWTTARLRGSRPVVRGTVRAPAPRVPVARDAIARTRVAAEPALRRGPPLFAAA